MACSYLSKYIAKIPDEQLGPVTGKQWGNSRDLPVEPFEVLKDFNKGGKYIIEKLRRWLLKHGRSSYALDVYFNEFATQVVFIDIKEFYSLIGSNPEYIDFSNL